MPGDAAASPGFWGGRNFPQKRSLRLRRFPSDRLPDFTGIFNRGLKPNNIKVLYLFAGIAAQHPDLSVFAPGDCVQQTEFVLNGLDIFLAENGLGRDNIIRIEFTLAGGFSDADSGAILGRFAGYFADVEVKPAAGTLRVVNALAFPGLVVEYEARAAR